MCVYCLEDEIKRLESLKEQIEKTIDTLRQITRDTIFVTVNRSTCHRWFATNSVPVVQGDTRTWRIDWSKKETPTLSFETSDNWSAAYSIADNIYGGITFVSKETEKKDETNNCSDEPEEDGSEVE